MTLFNGLMVLNGLMILVVLVRVRPGVLLIAVNQFLTLRALDNIQAYGQPSSQPFLPSTVFAEHNLDVTRNIFAISTLLLGVSLLWPHKSVANRASQFPAPSGRALLLLGAFIIAMAVSSETLLTHEYANNAGEVFGANFGGLNALIFSLVFYEIARRTLSGTWRPLTGLFVLAVILFITNYSKGSTGFATGYGLTAAVMFWPIERYRAARRVMVSLAVMASIGLTAYVVRGVRQVFFEKGFNSVTQFLQASDEGENQRAQTGQGFETVGNGTQYACHTLECVHLYESGITREWRSIYNPLIYTFEPSFLVGPLELTRPLDAPWELGRYYIGGGGIFILGDLYWNGGYFCVFVVFGFLLVLTSYCETRFRSSPFWLMMCAQFVPTLFMGVGYGFAQIIRGAINGLLVVGFYRVAPTLVLRFGRVLRRPAPRLSAQARATVRPISVKAT